MRTPQAVLGGLGGEVGDAGTLVLRVSKPLHLAGFAINAGWSVLGVPGHGRLWIYSEDSKSEFRKICL